MREVRPERRDVSGTFSRSAFAHLCRLAANFSFLDSLSRVRWVTATSKEPDLTSDLSNLSISASQLPALQFRIFA